jgi:hypothetical protein
MAGTKRQAASGQNERMSAVDTAWLRMDGPDNAMMIVTVMTSATPIPTAGLRRIIETRLLCFGRFRQRVEVDPLGASWLEDEHFDLDAHFVVARCPARAVATNCSSWRRNWQAAASIPRALCGNCTSSSAMKLAVPGCSAAPLLCRRHRHGAGLDVAHRTGCGPGARGSADEPSATQRGRGDKAAADPLRVLDWVMQLSHPIGDIVESALAEGARLLETGVHRLFHPQLATAVALQASGLIGGVRARPRPARRPALHPCARHLARGEGACHGRSRFDLRRGQGRQPGPRVHRQRRG